MSDLVRNPEDRFSQNKAHFLSGKSKDELAAKKRKTRSSAGCPYYKQDPIEDFRDQSLIEVKDIEQLVGLGRQLKACPYFGTRLAIPDAEVRVMAIL